MRKAIIDIGSNTINMLIAEISDGHWKKINESKSPARLAKGGINKSILAPEAMDRGVSALADHIAKAKEYECEEITAYATAAVRDANNKDVFLKRVQSELGLDINVISGDREAELITYGIKASGAMNDHTNLILDIGGGSTEFIIINSEGILFKKSYRLGVTRLLEQFNPGDPLMTDKINEITDYISRSTEDLREALNEFEPNRLVGASGSFDSLAKMSSELTGHPMNEIRNEILLPIYYSLAENCLKMNFEERSKIKGLAIHRVETVPMAVILLNYIFSIGKIEEIYQSSYALKEGVFEELYPT